MMTDQWGLCRHDRSRVMTTSNTWSYILRWTINHGDQGQLSDWAVAAAILYDRELNITEILEVGAVAAESRDGGG